MLYDSCLCRGVPAMRPIATQVSVPMRLSVIFVCTLAVAVIISSAATWGLTYTTSYDDPGLRCVAGWAAILHLFVELLCVFGCAGVRLVFGRFMVAAPR